MPHRFLWLLALALVEVVACTSAATPTPTLSPSPILVGPDGPLRCLDCEPVYPVSRIIDGDTFDISVGRVRIYGIDTPERDEACYDEATHRLAQLAEDGVRVEAGPRPTGGFGRLLFYVYTQDGRSIDEILITEGLAEAVVRDGQHRDFLVSMERKAKAGGVGCLHGESLR